MANKQSIIDASYPIESKVYALIACIGQEQKMKMTSRIKHTGVSLTQLQILHILSEAPKEGLTINQVKKFMVDDSPNVSRAVNKLVDAGHVVKARSQIDQRIVHVQITESGNKTHVDCDKELLALSLGLSEREIKQLYSLLVKI
ncbi:MarR family winged helix-turn-helix transcriptional regulator [Colwellia psychrerythraea]|uniref:HTH-type transcriptional regulator MgrA n=1 Tax=Colwellia psychrerythraea TaxID=28229 RepID=A0A099KVH2_COLPS|nr:MarR family transcriptional regulator [Colwellia psychrerythraea]KGJ94581.1 transcriptional regulator, MarR family [Colwellia psychrerythraea]